MDLYTSDQPYYVYIGSLQHYNANHISGADYDLISLSGQWYTE